MIKVKATKEYKKNNIQDSELKRIPEEGEIFEVSESRIDKLLGKNQYGYKFIEIIEEEKKPSRRIESKAILTKDKEDHNVYKSVLQDKSLE